MSERTPSPWRRYANEVETTPPNRKHLSEQVAVCDDRNDEGEANAAFIVRACNAHGDLVEALEDAAECLMWNGDDPKETLQGYIMDAHDRIRAALAKAKGE